MWRVLPLLSACALLGCGGNWEAVPTVVPDLITSNAIRDRVGIHLFERANPDTFRQQTDMSSQTLGLRWARFDFDWNRYIIIQGGNSGTPTLSGYAGQNLDRFRYANARGVTPIIVLSTQHDAIPESKVYGLGDDLGWPSSQRSRGQFVAFAIDVARRLAEIDPARRFALQIGNEMNNVPAWNQPQAKSDYVMLVRETVQALERERLHVNVITGGFSTKPADKGDSPQWPADIIRELNASGLGELVNGYAIHAYKTSQGTSPLYYATEELIPRIRDAKAAAGDLPLYVTECGYNSADFGREQGAYSMRAVLACLAAGSDVVILYQAFDRPDASSVREATYGLATATGELKESGRSFRDFLTQLGDARLEFSEATVRSRYQLQISGNAGTRFLRWSAGQANSTADYPPFPSIFASRRDP